MKKVLTFLALTALAACGADGEPVTPTASTTITGGSDGIQVAQNLRLNKGPVTVTLGLET